MKQQTFILILTTEIFVAAGYFLWRTYLYRELPRTIENLTGEWLLREWHLRNLDGNESDEWTEEFPWGEYNTYMTRLFDAGGHGGLEIKHEGDRIVFAKYYHWKLSGDSLSFEDDGDIEAHRIEKLTRTRLVLTQRREMTERKIFESTLIYDRPF